MEYSRNQLRVLWFLKRHGPLVRSLDELGPTKPGIVSIIGGELDIRTHTISYILRELESESLIIRSYVRPKSSFNDKGGYNPMIRLELVDPSMWLPEMPPPLPLSAVIAHENEDLEERVLSQADEPTYERVISALLDRNTELQGQIDKLVQVVKDQAAENDTLKKQVERSRGTGRVSGRLSQRVQDALTVEQWDNLRKR